MSTEPAHKNRYECRWRAQDGRQVHYWVDHSPSEPHWPDSAVMRWDLRPKDWDKIWPELVDHPCAMLFAPIHPHRPGPKRFGDWVQSWPEGFDWERSLPEHLHNAIRQSQKNIATGVTASTSAAAVNQTQPEQDMPARARLDLGPSDLIELLVSILVDVEDSYRPIIGQQLQALAMAPDSAKVVLALSELLSTAVNPKTTTMFV